jgi:transcriptional regulator with XRE-family HTH domain
MYQKYQNVSRKTLRKVSKERKGFDTVGEYLRYLRREKGLSQAQLEAKCDLTSKIVSKWETNRHEVSPEFRIKLSNYFDVPAANFANQENPEIENLENEVFDIKRLLELNKASELSQDDEILALEVAELLIRSAKEALKKSRDSD